MEIFKIIDVIDVATGKRSEKYGYRIGRVGRVQYRKLDEPMIFEYLNNSFFMTTDIQDISKKEYMDKGIVIIETKNRIYKLKKEE